MSTFSGQLHLLRMSLKRNLDQEGLLQQRLECEIDLTINYLTVNCRASLFRYLSQFPHSLSLIHISEPTRPKR